MRPDLTGQGLGRAFAEAVLTHGHAISGVGRLRAVVQEWNARGRRLLTGLGFAETGTHDVGDVTYVVYERDA
jgi:RimJ/RimL family protein N-acetyltransferase